MHRLHGRKSSPRCPVLRRWCPSAVHNSHAGRCCGSFFFNDTATTEIYTLSLHDALPISVGDGNGGWKPYNPPPKPPAGPTGVSVGDGNGGWKPYNPPPKPPAGPTGISVGDGNGGWKPYIPPPKPPIGASAFDPSTGRTTTSTRNADGSHT